MTFFRLNSQHITHSVNPSVQFLHLRYAPPRLPERSHSIPPHRALLRVLPPLRVIFLPSGNITKLTLYPSAPPVSIDQIVSDFDNVTFHISTPESKTKILVSIAVKCYKELVQYGAQEVLEREYGPYIVAPETGYDFSVLVDLQQLPEEAGVFVSVALRDHIPTLASTPS